MKDDITEESESFAEILNSHDELGLILRTSFMAEKLIDQYIEAKLNIKNPFKNINLTTKNKIIFSKNLGLPTVFSNFYLQLNTERNRFAHQKNHAIGKNFIDEMLKLSLQATKDYKKDMTPYNLFRINTRDELTVKIDESDIEEFNHAPLRKRFECIFVIMYMITAYYVINLKTLEGNSDNENPQS